MIYELRAPRIMTEEATLRLEVIYVCPGDALVIGQKLFDLSIDMSVRYSQNCPPISYYRVVARERGRLRSFDGAAGAVFEPEAALGLVSSDPEEDLEAAPSRAFRVNTAGIIWHEQMWSASAPS